MSKRSALLAATTDSHTHNHTLRTRSATNCSQCATTISSGIEFNVHSAIVLNIYALTWTSAAATETNGTMLMINNAFYTRVARRACRIHKYKQFMPRRTRALNIEMLPTRLGSALSHHTPHTHTRHTISECERARASSLSALRLPRSAERIVVTRRRAHDDDGDGLHLLKYIH